MVSTPGSGFGSGDQGVQALVPLERNTAEDDHLALGRCNSWLRLGKASPQPFRPPKPEDVDTICYTSGTTGTPKGAVISHENLIANVAGSNLNIKFYPSDVYISYLPLAHIYERVNQVALLHCGVAVGFYQGDNLKLMDDLAVLRPTVFASVPRLYNRIYAAITNAVKESGGLKEKLFHSAYNAKRQAIIKGNLLLDGSYLMSCCQIEEQIVQSSFRFALRICK
ncbi:long chain acyl-CoA synthetase 6, peroxisomal isoform X7 [Setaria viridis]|uniref:long chain acyl-CoA synthetase 6, peroxisomal isoform X7 n=1 Tax=Setaria viridis TaxID=4556 RepID=UPI003B3B0A5F